MSFLLDTDHLSAHLRRPAGLAHRFIQHSGRLYTSTVALAELQEYSRPKARRLARALRGRCAPLVPLINVIDHRTTPQQDQSGDGGDEEHHER